MPVSEPGKIRNIAVVGHRGVGKTSLVEAMLFQAGKTNRLGTIDAAFIPTLGVLLAPGGNGKAQLGVQTQYRYSVVNDRTVLVDPQTRRIIQVIE